MENHNYRAQMSISTCPMHAGVTATQDNSCSTCGMDLKPSQQENTDQYQVQLTTLPEIIEAGYPVRLTFSIKKNKELVQLDISHEMKIHVMVVSKDLNWFQRIYPVQQKDGTYAVTQTLHNGGEYLLFACFKPLGLEKVLHKLEIEVQGYYMTSREVSSNKPIAYTDDYKVTLENAEDFKTSKTQTLKIAIEKCEKKLEQSDLEQYLGTHAHIVLINKIDKDFLHIHPVSHGRYPIYAETKIEKAGKYKMWVQFKIHGKLHTADFNISVYPERESERKVHFHQHQL